MNKNMNLHEIIKNISPIHLSAVSALAGVSYSDLLNAINSAADTQFEWHVAIGKVSDYKRETACGTVLLNDNRTTPFTLPDFHGKNGRKHPRVGDDVEVIWNIPKKGIQLLAVILLSKSDLKIKSEIANRFKADHEPKL